MRLPVVLFLITLVCSAISCHTRYIEPSVDVERVYTTRPISQSDVAFAGFYNYYTQQSGRMIRLFSDGNHLFVKAYSADHISALPVTGRTPVDHQRVANLILSEALRPALNEDAVAAQDLKTARGVYQAIVFLKASGYEDFSEVFSYNADEDQLYMNNYGRPYIAFGRHEPTFRKPNFGWGLLNSMVNVLHFLTIGTIPTFWKDPAETKISVYDRNMELVATAHFDHSTMAIAGNWVEGGEYMIPDGNQNPHAGGIPRVSANAVYKYMKERGDGLFEKK